MKPSRRLPPLALAPLAALLIGSVGPDETWDGKPAARDAVQFQSVMLAGHNMARQAVGASPLAWDAQLAADATAYAKQLAASSSFDHAEQTEQGENLWMGTKRAFPYHRMIGAWVEEKKFFTNRPIPAVSTTGDFDDVGHYTQLIWRTTTHVGCGIAADREEEYVVCRYKNAGNVWGETAI
jgi:hypothetical protein